MKLDSVRTTEILILKCGQTHEKLNLNVLLHSLVNLALATIDSSTYDSICINMTV